MPDDILIPDPIGAGHPRWRVIIYAIVVGAVGVLLAVGTLTGAQHDSILAAANAALNLGVAGLLIFATRRITADSWSTLRAALYATVAGVSSVLGAWGLIDPVAAAGVLQVTDQILSAVQITVLTIAAVKVPAEPAADVEG